MYEPDKEGPEFRGEWSYQYLVEYCKSDQKLEPVEVAFEKSMSLLAQANQNILRLRSRINDLESDISDYRAREATIDVMTLRSEVRALRTRISALETTLKLYQRRDGETANRKADQ